MRSICRMRFYKIAAIRAVKIRATSCSTITLSMKLNIIVPPVLN